VEQQLKLSEQTFEFASTVQERFANPFPPNRHSDHSTAIFCPTHRPLTTDASRLF
jgi:hypothetical protein